MSMGNFREGVRISAILEGTSAKIRNERLLVCNLKSKVLLFGYQRYYWKEQWSH